jgi:hypothetical protein
VPDGNLDITQDSIGLSSALLNRYFVAAESPDSKRDILVPGLPRDPVWNRCSPVRLARLAISYLGSPSQIVRITRHDDSADFV